MTKYALPLLAAALFAIYPDDLSARGGGGGRMGGGAGGGRNFSSAGRSMPSGGSRNFSAASSGGRNFSSASTRNFGGAGDRVPSMGHSSSYNAGAGNRAASYNRSGIGASGFNGRPTSSDLGHFLNMPSGSGAGSSFGGRGPSGIGGSGIRPGAGGSGTAGSGNRPGSGGAGIAGGGSSNRPGGGIAGGGKGPGGTNRPATGGTAGAGNRPGAGGAGTLAGNRGSFNGGSRTGVNASDHQHAQNIRNNFQGNHNNFYNNSHNWYNHNWWGAHGGAWNHGWNYWHGWGPGAWWNGAAWGALGGFMVGSWATPMWYGYGTGGNVVYQGDTVYVNGQSAGTPAEYYDQAQQIAATPVDDAAANGDWMPLGVFTVSSNPDDDHPVMMMQMAVSKEGNIAGMYYNTSDDASLPIQGAVDRKTQRAAWTIGDKKNTVLETGIYNLTQDETPVLVHFGDQKTQNWLMVRLNKPESGSQDVFGPAPGSNTAKPTPGPQAPSDQ